jgi:hypothetical protein
MILVDTSVWVDYFRDMICPETSRLEQAIREAEVSTCGMVVTEVLQGLGDTRWRARLQQELTLTIFLPMSFACHVLAAELYVAARARGRTVRNTADCVIAACAIWHEIPLLQRDRDFETLAEVTALRLVKV